MDTYASVLNGEIINVCVWDGVTPYAPGNGVLLIAISRLPEGAGIGWKQVDGVWSPPM